MFTITALHIKRSVVLQEVLQLQLLLLLAVQPQAQAPSQGPQHPAPALGAPLHRHPNLLRRKPPMVQDPRQTVLVPPRAAVLAVL